MVVSCDEGRTTASLQNMPSYMFYTDMVGSSRLTNGESASSPWNPILNYECLCLFVKLLGLFLVRPYPPEVIWEAFLFIFFPNRQINVRLAM
jgi:hypothetical protein